MIEGRVLCILENMDKRKTRASARRQQPKKRTGKQKFAFVIGCVFAFLVTWNLPWLIETWENVTGYVHGQYAMGKGSYYVEQTKRLFRKPVTFLGVKLNASEKGLLEKAPFFNCHHEEGASIRMRKCSSFVAHKTGNSSQSYIGDFVRPSPVFDDSQHYRIFSYDKPDPEVVKWRESLSNIHLTFFDDKLKHVYTDIHGTSVIKEALKQLTAVYGAGKENKETMAWSDRFPISFTWNLRGGRIIVYQKIDAVYPTPNGPYILRGPRSSHRHRAISHYEPNDDEISIVFVADDYHKLKHEIDEIGRLESLKQKK